LPSPSSDASAASSAPQSRASSRNDVSDGGDEAADDDSTALEAELGAMRRPRHWVDPPLELSIRQMPKRLRADNADREERTWQLASQRKSMQDKSVRVDMRELHNPANRRYQVSFLPQKLTEEERSVKTI
jgi:hypothetical protein